MHVLPNTTFIAFISSVPSFSVFFLGLLLVLSLVLQLKVIIFRI